MKFVCLLELLVNFFHEKMQGVVSYDDRTSMLFTIHIKQACVFETILIGMFADDATLTRYTEHDLQKLINQFNQACKQFGLTIKLKVKLKIKTPWVKIFLHPHQSASIMHCLKLRITSYKWAFVSLTIYHMEIDKRIVKASSVMAKLIKRVS